MFLHNRVGKFSIDVQTVRELPQTVQAIMGDCIIVRCEHLFPSDSFEYIAYSKMFEVVGKGSVINTYSIEIDYDTGDYKFIKEG